jgi:hypothetical protein
MNFTTYCQDIEKRIFQLYRVNRGSGEIYRRKFGKLDLLACLRSGLPEKIASVALRILTME